MKIRNKILLGVLTTLLLSGMAITAIWYSTSRKLLDTYLENISNSTMLDAYHAFEYLLTILPIWQLLSRRIRQISLSRWNIWLQMN